jgi:hypothetical protein
MLDAPPWHTMRIPRGSKPLPSRHDARSDPFNPAVIYHLLLTLIKTGNLLFYKYINCGILLQGTVGDFGHSKGKADAMRFDGAGRVRTPVDNRRNGRGDSGIV